MILPKNYFEYSLIGDKLYVYKANQIIPQVDSWEHVGEYKDDICLHIPEVCPICGGSTSQRTDISSTVLVCDNPQCDGKLINKLDHFCGKKGLDIKGLSKATLEKLIDWGWVSCVSDIFTLSTRTDEWVQKTGFGPKSVEKVLNAIEISKSTNLHQFIAALGVPLIGTTASKKLEAKFDNWQAFMQAVESGYKFYDLPDFGVEMHNALSKFDYAEAKYIADNFITFISITPNLPNVKEKTLTGMTFVITGKVNHFKNRDELKTLIESLGGKVVGSVSKNTTYLINNDINSTSAKNKSAQSLGIPILTEEMFIETFGVH